MGISKLDGSTSDGERMRCMEVWGGNCEVNKWFEMPGLETWVYSKPFGDSQGGGDVYYASSCASGRITRLLLGDVSGHGKEVAEVALGLRDLMRENVNVVKQTQFVEGMNRQFAGLSEQGAFATAIVATFFQPTRRFTMCNAGHPRPFWYDAACGRWSEVQEAPDISSVVTGTPLGVHDQAIYPQVQLELKSGDMVLLYSDALNESLDSSGELLGTEGLLRTVGALNSETPDRLLPNLLTSVEANDANNLARDDLTMMLIRATGTSTKIRDNLLAPVRYFRTVGDSTSLK